MTNIWGWATTSLHISSFTPFSWQPSSYKLLPTAGKWLSVPLCVSSQETTFFRRYPERSKLPSILPDTFCRVRQWLQNGLVCEEKSSVIRPTTVHTSAALEWSSLPGGPPFFVPIQLPIWTANWQHQGDLEQSLSGPGLNNPSRWETVITARRLTESLEPCRDSVS